MKLLLATNNQGKINEMKEFLNLHKIEFITAKDLNIEEPKETGTIYFENALIKAKAYADFKDYLILSDDSGIEIEALENKPGVDTAPFTKEHGGLKNVWSMWENDEKIQKNPNAAFVCTQILLFPNGKYENFETKVFGKIVFPPKGENGHGYDPIFMPNGINKTKAQMNFDELLKYSHRLLTLKKVLDFLKV